MTDTLVTALGLGSVVFLLVLVLDTLKRWRTKQLYYKDHKGPYGLPLTGCAHMFFGDSSAVLENVMKIIEAYESPVPVYLGTQLFILLDNPEDIQIVVNSSKSLAKHHSYKFFQETADSLFSADVHIWKPSRRVINGTFTSKYLQGYLPAFNRNNQRFLKNIARFEGKDRTFDIGEYYMGLSLSIICETAMGYDAKSIEDPENCDVLKMIKWINREDYLRIYKPWLHPNWIYRFVESSVTKEYRRRIRDITMGVIGQRREFWRKQHEKEKKDGVTEEIDVNNFLDIMLETVDNKQLTDKYLREETLVMIIGGAETTALANSFGSLMMGMHPEIQRKAQKEVDAVYDAAGSCHEVSEEMLKKFEYLEQCIMETLRRYCVAPIYLREPAEDMKLTNINVPKGAAIGICAQAMHMNPKYYSDPERFNPDRWLPEEVAKRHKYSFMAFSGGPRGCIGMKFGLRSAKLTMSQMLRHYNFYTPWKMSDIKLKSELLLMSRNGYPVSIEPRGVCPCQKANSVN